MIRQPFGGVPAPAGHEDALEVRVPAEALEVLEPHDVGRRARVGASLEELRDGRGREPRSEHAAAPTGADELNGPGLQGSL